MMFANNVLRYVSTKWYIFVGFFLLLSAFKSIAAFFEPRLWAEEGSLFYSNAYIHGILYSFQHPYLGYFALLNNTIGALLTFVAIYYVPFITMFLGLLIQQIPVVIVFFLKSKYWDTTLKKVLFALFYTLSIPYELWSNTTCSHFILGLSCLLLVLVDYTSLTRKSFLAILFLVVVSMLSGPSACFATPFIILRALVEKDKRIIILAIVAFAASLFQLYYVVFEGYAYTQSQRWGQFDFFRFIQQIAINGYSFIIPTNGIYRIIIVVAVLTTVAIGMLHSSAEDRKKCLMILAMQFLVVLISAKGALLQTVSPRYSFSPSNLLFIVMLNFTFFQVKWLRYWITSILVAVILLLLFFYPVAHTYSWSQEYQAFVASPTKEINILPNGFKVKMK